MGEHRNCTAAVFTENVVLISLHLQLLHTEATGNTGSFQVGTSKDTSPLSAWLFLATRVIWWVFFHATASKRSSIFRHDFTEPPSKTTAVSVGPLDSKTALTRIDMPSLNTTSSFRAADPRSSPSKSQEAKSMGCISPTSSLHYFAAARLATCPI